VNCVEIRCSQWGIPFALTRKNETLAKKHGAESASRRTCNIKHFLPGIDRAGKAVSSSYFVYQHRLLLRFHVAYAAAQAR